MLKKVIVAGVMATILSLGATFANAGIIVAGKSGDGTSATSSSTLSSALSSTGIIVFGLTTGIIVFGATDVPPVTVDGIIVFG